MAPRFGDQIVVTDDDQGPVVNIVAWICMVTMCLGVLTRLALKLTATLKPGWDDLMTLLAMILVVVQTVVVSEQVKNGLGKRMEDLSESQLRGYQKAGHAADILILPILTLSKTSMFALLSALTPNKKWHKWLSIAIWLTVTWGAACLLALCFRCGMPDPWRILDSEKCYNPTSFWATASVVDIATELLIIIIPIVFVRPLKMSFSRKAMVVFAFSFRILVVIFTILRLKVIGSPNTDPTFDEHKTTVYTQLVLTLSVLVSCIPFLRAFMDNLESGLLANHGQHGNFKTGTNELGYHLKGMSHSGSSGSRGYRNCEDSHHDAEELRDIQVVKPQQARVNAEAKRRSDSSDAGSMNSGGSRREIIRKGERMQGAKGTA